MMATDERRGWSTTPLPLFLVALSLFLLAAFQLFQAIQDRAALSELQRSQEPAVQQGVKLRQRLEALAGATAQLAADGNENAKAIVEEMKRQGVTLSQPKK